MQLGPIQSAFRTRVDVSVAPRHRHMCTTAVDRNVCGRPLVEGERALTADNPNYGHWLPPAGPDDRDKKGADGWISRDPALLRLTGVHPFNAEPTGQELVEHGWITPVSKHYVRNHGAVPKLSWETHTIRIDGLVRKPLEISMGELVKLPNVTIPVMVSCIGNRRKEVNQLKRSQGYDWGNGALATNWWTGVRLSDVLKLADPKSYEEGARHVLYSGPKGELPRGDDGTYGTSMLLTYATDPANDVLIAFKQNGQYLHPDHGFPCRMLVPGWIGGRMVKWLSHITVTEADSDNYYHKRDNKILPPVVQTAEQAEAEGWWDNPDFVQKDLLINSIITHPGHDERVYLDEAAPYTMRGYAYGGGGRKITCVEVSFDGGNTFPALARLEINEEPTRYGKYWTWVFWSLDISTGELFEADEVMVRAFDAAGNTQPAALTWSLLGDGNNSMFRVKIHRELDDGRRPCLRFQHPAPLRPGPLGNVGWLEEAKAAAAPPPPPEDGEQSEGGGKDVKYVTMEMVQRHSSEESVWFVHKGKVYDPTPFLSEHPGGAEAITMMAGQDATEEFEAVHDDYAHQLMKKYYIADLLPDGKTAPPEQMYDDGAGGGGGGLKDKRTGHVAQDIDAAGAGENAAGDADAPFLTAARGVKRAVLRDKQAVSHDVVKFRFGLERDDQRLGLPIGHHVMLRRRAPKDGGGGDELVMRPYTPTTADETLGHFDLVVKIYRANENSKFPKGGRMSQILEGLEVGDDVEVQGPIGHFTYLGKGRFTADKRDQRVQRINMIAGGTGITPMYQVMKFILSDADDPTQLRLIFANKTVDDILLRNDLEELQRQHPERFQLHYTLSGDAPPDWPYSKGYVSEDMCREHLLVETQGTVNLLCGPPPMVKACHPVLEAMGFGAESMIDF